MRKFLLAAVATAALATPATARDKSLYVGVEGGLMLVEDTKLRYEYDGEGAFDINEAVTVDHKYGFDIDLVGGYDFGLIRTELELMVRSILWSGRGFIIGYFQEVTFQSRLGLSFFQHPSTRSGDLRLEFGKQLRRCVLEDHLGLVFD